MRWEWLLMNQTDGPMAGSVMGTELHFKTSKVVSIWAGINKDELVGPFWVEDELKQLPELLPVFRRQFPQASVQEKKSASFKKTVIFMQDIPWFHAFEGLTDERTMTWPSSWPQPAWKPVDPS